MSEALLSTGRSPRGDEPRPLSHDDEGRHLILQILWTSSRPGLLPFRRVLPPRLLRPAFHVPNSGNEGVEQARVVALAGEAAQFVVHHIRITPRQLGGRGDPQLAKVSGDGGADVGDVFEGGDISKSRGLASSSSSGWLFHICCSFFTRCRSPAATPSPALPPPSRWRNGAGRPSAPSRCLQGRRPRRCWGRTAPSAVLSPGIRPVATARRAA